MEFPVMLIGLLVLSTWMLFAITGHASTDVVRRRFDGVATRVHDVGAGPEPSSPR